MNKQDEINYYNALEEELQQAKLTSSRVNREYQQLQGMNDTQQVNLIQWQLDLQQELNRIQHFLRGDVITTTAEGDENWSSPTDKRNITLSGNGVDTLSNIISFLINKNLILSNFDSEEINWKMKDFSDELADNINFNHKFIFYKPDIAELIEADIDTIKKLEDKYGKIEITEQDSSLIKSLKNKLSYSIYSKIENIKSKTLSDYESESFEIYKSNIKKYPLITNLIVQSVHATYNRALKGGERESLRRNVHVTQTQPLGMGNNTQFQSQQSRFSIWRPSTWK